MSCFYLCFTIFNSCFITIIQTIHLTHNKVLRFGERILINQFTIFQAESLTLQRSLCKKDQRERKKWCIHCSWLDFLFFGQKSLCLVTTHTFHSNVQTWRIYHVSITDNIFPFTKKYYFILDGFWLKRKSKTSNCIHFTLCVHFAGFCTIP